MWETIKAKLFSKDVWVRAGKTFVQAAVAYLIIALSNVDIFSGNNGKTFWVGLLLSTLSAAASAAWNGVIKPAFSEVVVAAKE
ncbi:MAG TPA: hypothetical protein PKN45_11050 [Candidatus Limiplasma sp.]|nr:hypothetical protein [Candidatus Limiplasma sp.]